MRVQLLNAWSERVHRGGGPGRKFAWLSPSFLRVCHRGEQVQSVWNKYFCVCGTIGPGSRWKFWASVMLARLLSLPRVCENGWKVCVYFSVCICDSRWRMGRQDGAGDDEWGDRQRRIALYPSVTIPLSLSLSSLSLPVGMMQCLLFSGSEEEKDGGKMGRRWKEKKIAFIHNQCLLRPPFLLLLSSHPFLLLLPLLLHFHHLFSCLSSIPVPSPLLPLLIRISCLHHSFWSYSAPPTPFIFRCRPLFCFFFPPFLSDQKNSSHPDTHFHTQFLCVHTCLCASFFVGCIFIQVNFSSSRVNRSAFIRTCMRCFYKCVCVCVWSAAEWPINHADGRCLFCGQVPVFWKVLGSWDRAETWVPPGHTPTGGGGGVCAGSHESVKNKWNGIPFLWFNSLFYY